MSSKYPSSSRLWILVNEEKSAIITIYFFAMLGGLVQLSIPLGVQSIIGFVLAGSLSASLVILVTVIVAGVFFTGMMQINQMKVIESIQQRIFARYSYQFTDRIPRLNLKKIDDFYLPELVNRFFDTTNLQKSISKLLLDLPIATIQVLFGLILLSFYHSLFIVFGIVLLLMLWLMLKFTAGKGMSTSLDESRFKYALVGWFEELARLVRSFKISSASGLHIRKADEKTIGYLTARTSHFRVLLVQYRTLVFFKTAITLCMLVTGVHLLLKQQINIGQFVAAEIVIILIINSIEKIIINLDSVYDVLTAMEKLGKLTEKPTELSGKLLPTIDKPASITAEKLSFSFDGSNYVLQDISFNVKAGDKVCLVGPEGAGKSTLINLLAGVYSEFDGKLLLDATPVANYDLASLRLNTGVLLHQEGILHGTVWENISMGRQDLNKEFVKTTIQACGLNDFVASLPIGYDTMLDPGGKRLPLNIVKKLLVVRALASRPKMIFLDEPWTGIEEQYQKSIADFVLNLSGSTVIISCNNSWFMEKCDSIISLQN